MEKISEAIVTQFFNKVEKNDERDVLIFGVQRILEDITKLIVILTLSYFLNIIKEILIVFATMIIYKNFIGGAHAQSNIECLFYTTLFCMFPIYFTKYFLMNETRLIIFTMITILFSAFVIYKYAPADTENVPIVNKKMKRNLKIGACIVLTIILVAFGIIIKNTYLYQIVLICINLSNLNTTPLMYKLLKCKYSNGEL